MKKHTEITKIRAFHQRLRALRGDELAHSLSAKKRVRQNARRNQRNSAKRSTVRTALKRTVAAIEDGDKEKAQEALNAVSSILDRYSHKGLIHKNKAARHKSRLNAKVKALSA